MGLKGRGLIGDLVSVQSVRFCPFSVHYFEVNSAAAAAAAAAAVYVE